MNMVRMEFGCLYQWIGIFWEEALYFSIPVSSQMWHRHVFEVCYLFKAKFDKRLHGQLDKCFSRDAVKRALSYHWDEVKGCVVLAADKAVEDLIDWWDLDVEYDFPRMDTTKFELDISEVTKVEDTSKVYDLFGAGQ